MKLIKPIDCAEAIYKALRTPMLKGTFTDTMSLAMSLVKEVPTIDAEPVKHGHWIKLFEDKDSIQARCSACGMVYTLGKGRDPNYCGTCGAKMDEGDKE